MDRSEHREAFDGETPEKEPDEINVGMQPHDPDVVFQLMQQPSIQSRELAFETVINLSSHPNEDLAHLVSLGVFPQIISNLNPNNSSIIGIVCSALRNLAIAFPEQFESSLDSIPYEFLLSLPKCSESIDLLQVACQNFDSFAEHLSAFSSQLTSSLANWLQSDEPIAHSSLELIYTLAQLSVQTEIPFPIDFNMVKPLLDASVPPRLRALSARTLFLIEHNPTYINFIIELLGQTDFSQYPAEQAEDVFEIIHDSLIDENPAPVLKDAAEAIGEAAKAGISLGSAAVVLSDIATLYLPQKCHEYVELIYAQENLYFERADAIFRIMSFLKEKGQEMKLTPDMLMKTLTKYTDPASLDHMSCLEAILRENMEIFSMEDIQTAIVPAFELKPHYAYQAFLLIIEGCANCPVIPPLLEAMHTFVDENKSDIDEEAMEQITLFFQKHQ